MAEILFARLDELTGAVNTAVAAVVPGLVSAFLAGVTGDVTFSGSVSAISGTYLSSNNVVIRAAGTRSASQIAFWSSSTQLSGVTLTGLVKSNGASAPTVAVSATDYAPATTGTSILKASSGGFANAVANTDYLPVANPTFTGNLIGPNIFGGTAIGSGLTVAASTNVANSGDVLNLYGSTINLGNTRSAVKTINLGGGGSGVNVNIGTTGDGLVQLMVGGSGTPQQWVPNTNSSVITFPSVTGTLVDNNAPTAFTAQQYFTTTTTADGATITWNVATGQKTYVLLGGNRTMAAVTGAIQGGTYSIFIAQDGTGSRTLTWTTSGTGSFDFGTAGAPTLTTTATKADLLTFEAINLGASGLKLRFTGIMRGFTA